MSKEHEKQTISDLIATITTIRAVRSRVIQLNFWHFYCF